VALTREDWRRDGMRQVWENKELNVSPEGIADREVKAAKRGITRAALEDEQFNEWLVYMDHIGCGRP
jgi:hypothetical protein